MAVNEFEVIVIGGGITGAGVARDCAMRGLKTLLLERGDFAEGATGRNHGLLHSGARYAVSDNESAVECISENMILKRIAPHCIEKTDGLFICLPEDDLAYQQKFIDSCRKAGIKAEAIDPKEAIRLEPSVNPNLTGAVRVPDGAVDPFSLTISNIIDAKAHGATVLTRREAVSLIMEGGRVMGVKAKESANGEISEYRAQVTVNASGIWGQNIAAMAGARIQMFPAKGSLLVFGHRINRMVINRCRKSSDADILVPGQTVCIIGTTSQRVPYDSIDDVRPTPEEVDLLIREGSKLAPELSTARILRAYAGVRPLVAADDDPSGRNISRGIVCLDHEVRDGIKGFITITGGKLMTYRLMAEKATELVCQKIGKRVDCRTAVTVLPQPEATAGHTTSGTSHKKVVCECEHVTEDDIRKAVMESGASTLSELRKRTRLGMGTCQGQLCAGKAAEILSEPDLKGFLEERWKGIHPIAWADSLREAQLTQWIYRDLK